MECLEEESLFNVLVLFPAYASNLKAASGKIWVSDLVRAAELRKRLVRQRLGVKLRLRHTDSLGGAPRYMRCMGIESTLLDVAHTHRR